MIGDERMNRTPSSRLSNGGRPPAARALARVRLRHGQQEDARRRPAARRRRRTPPPAGARTGGRRARARRRSRPGRRSSAARARRPAARSGTISGVSARPAGEPIALAAPGQRRERDVGPELGGALERDDEQQRDDDRLGEARSRRRSASAAAGRRAGPPAAPAARAAGTRRGRSGRGRTRCDGSRRPASRRRPRPSASPKLEPSMPSQSRRKSRWWSAGGRRGMTTHSAFTGSS